ncbi:MAG: Ig-like domain-containing protein [Gammaproteobacteria bacterium]|nr:Ig-like domain-containing protein [Gammaproteobacteria bacterium]MDE0246688.1 Ig-like domain-containing protein [Gammaproteobacteria bacterium]
MIRNRTILTLAAVFVAAALAHGCGDDDVPTAPMPEAPVPTTVSVSPAAAELAALGATVQLAAEVLDQNGQAMAGATVTWTTGDATVATVDAAGLAAAVANGTTAVTASAGSASGGATVTVAQEIAGVAVSPAADTLLAGDTLRLMAAASDANGHAVEGTEFAWASNDTLVARVDDVGLVTAVGAGESVVTAISSGVAGRAELTVLALAPTTIAVSPDTVALTALGQTAQLATDVRDQAGRVMDGVSVAWTSADTTIAAVDSIGLVTAVGSGGTTIVAKAGQASGEAAVRVAQSADSVAVSPAADTVALADTLRLIAEAFDDNGHAIEAAEFGWSSSDSSVAQVDESGLVKGVSEGMATITASAGNASGASEITVENPDRAALVTLYHATDGPNWRNNTNWLTDAPLDEWYGVNPWENFGGRVGTLDLRLNKLTGTIPPELGRLTELRYLGLSQNELTGTIPRELGSLTNLGQLSLDENYLSGAIPPEVLTLPYLGRLDLGGNPDLCAPADPNLLARLRELNSHVYPCTDPNVRLLPSALMREDGNGMSLALPDDLRDLSAIAVNVTDPSVVAVSVADGWLDLLPVGIGSAEVELVPSGGGHRLVAGVQVRAAVGTFGIDIVMDQPIPLGYGEAIVKAADWWSYILDGTEWPDREAGCLTRGDLFDGKVKAVSDELLIGARAERIDWAVAYANTCVHESDGEQSAVPLMLPASGYVVSSFYVLDNQHVLRHEIGHVLGLVLWPQSTGLVTSDCRFFTGPKAVEAFRAGGGDPGLAGVPVQGNCGAHWHPELVDEELMTPGGGHWDVNSISLGALVDIGYTIDLSKALPWPPSWAVDELRPDVVLGEPRVFIERKPRDPPRR